MAAEHMIEIQQIDGEDVSAVLRTVMEHSKGPRDGNALLILAIKMLNRAPHRKRTPSDEELIEEFSVALKSIKIISDYQHSTVVN